MLREALLLAIPTAFDLAATVLMNVGLLSVTASVYQMVRTQSGRTANIFFLYAPAATACRELCFEEEECTCTCKVTMREALRQSGANTKVRLHDAGLLMSYNLT